MSEPNTDQDDSVRDALVRITFVLDGEQMETFLGTSIPIPRKGEEVRLSELEQLAQNEEDGSQSMETEIEEGEDHTVDEVTYNYYKADVLGDVNITAPITLVIVRLESDDQEEEDNE